VPSRTVVLPNPTGLHARPAKVFAQAAGEAAASGATVTLAKGDQSVNARSVLSVLTLDCHQGDEVTISVEGEGADEVLARLVDLVESGLGESGLDESPATASGSASGEGGQ
jgi:phosphotransferase system HPr (HPr) family protein